VSPVNDLSPGEKNGKRYGRRLGTALIDAEESHKFQATGYKERVESRKLQAVGYKKFRCKNKNYLIFFFRKA
jgi:hypothetical protein